MVYLRLLRSWGWSRSDMDIIDLNYPALSRLPAWEDHELVPAGFILGRRAALQV